MGVAPKSRGAVLVVDDDEEIRSELRTVLEYGRYFVLEADNGEQALEILRSGAARAIRLVVLCARGHRFCARVRR